MTQVPSQLRRFSGTPPSAAAPTPAGTSTISSPPPQQPLSGIHFRRGSQLESKSLTRERLLAQLALVDTALGELPLLGEVRGGGGGGHATDGALRGRGSPGGCRRRLHLHQVMRGPLTVRAGLARDEM